MITNLIIPVQDTESAQFSYDGNLSTKDYENMMMDRFRRTDSQIDMFMHRDRNSLYAYDLEGDYDSNYGDINEIYDQEVEVEALLLDGRKNNFDEDYLFDLVDANKMFILRVNVNTEEMDDGAESELKFWLDDSMRVWDDDDLDKKTKLDASPTRDLKIVLSDGNKYTLKNCKIFEDYSNERHPMYFAMIVEKISL